MVRPVDDDGRTVELRARGIDVALQVGGNDVLVALELCLVHRYLGVDELALARPNPRLDLHEVERRVIGGDDVSLPVGAMPVSLDDIKPEGLLDERGGNLLANRPDLMGSQLPYGPVAHLACVHASSSRPGDLAEEGGRRV